MATVTGSQRLLTLSLNSITVGGGSVTSSTISNWNTAYSWGNHASVGYLTSVPNLDASKITTGTFSTARIPNLSASKITSGTLNAARIPDLSGTYAVTGHNHNGVYEPAFSKNNAFNKNFGTAAGTVAQGNDSRINNGNTAHGWGNHASAGYLTSFDITSQTDPKYLRSNANDTATGTITFTGGITGFDINNGISGNNFNITGVNQLSINDPGEGIYFGGGANNVNLYAIDDSADNKMNFGGANQLQVNGRRVFEANYHPNADKWTTARSHTVTLTGDVTGSATQSVDGTGNKTWSITTTVANNSHTHDHIQGGNVVSTNLNTIASQANSGELHYDSFGQSAANRPPTNDNANGVISVGQHSGPYTAQLAFSSNGRMYYRDNPNNTFGSWQELWTSGNDGSGSGLDADLLDGQHGSHYLNYNNLTNKPTIPSAPANATITLSAGTGLSGGGNFTTNQSSAETLTFNLTTPTDAPSSWQDVVGWNGALIKDTAVEIHGSGYLRASYLNMTHGVGTRSSDTVFYSSTDDYIRKTNATGMRAALDIYTKGEVNNLIPTIPTSLPANGGNADTVDGVHAHGAVRNNQANKLVRTDGNGYIQAGWINTTSGSAGTTTMDRIYASYDGYVRYYTPANFGAQISSHINYNNIQNKPTIPSTANLVTTNTAQTISGAKTFTANVGVSGNVSANFYAFNGAYVNATADVRAPIFYDRNNTAFYVHADGESVLGNVRANDFRLSTGNGKGVRFWNSNSYKIYMSSTGDTSWGGRAPYESTSDYNMYFRMTGGTNRGFVFRNNTTNVAGIDASGNFNTSGIIKTGNGAASAPAYSFTADHDSGMFSIGSNAVGFATGGTQRFKINSNGLLLTGTSSLWVNGQQTITNTRDIANVVNYQNTDGHMQLHRTGAAPLIINRKGTTGSSGTSRGEILNFKSASTKIGRIGYAQPYGGTLYFATGNTSGYGVGVNHFSSYSALLPVTHTGANNDNSMDLGSTSARYDDVYATNGTIQTSDRNEKQDIQELTDAETRAAVTCKGLMRRFRWVDSVAEKGDDARYHFGAIAQDVEAAFTAEGLDAGDYGLFIRSTWWEHEGFSYPSAEEAPEGAVEKTRLGIRYNQLFAFIIGAL